MDFDSATANEWLYSPLGARVLREEALLARSALDDVFGFELLQVGTWGASQELLSAARTPHTTVVAPQSGAGVTLCAALDLLPFAADAIDAILLPHTLEWVEDPYAVLREAERVLCAEGCLMICGFNPLSGWGVRQLCARYLRRPAFPPQMRRMISEGRLRDWVALLGFEVDSVRGYLGYLPLSGAASAKAHPAFLSGAYWLKARKRVPTLTQVRPRRRVISRVLVSATEPTSKMLP